MLFKDRVEAGQKLAQKLKAYANRQDVLTSSHRRRRGIPKTHDLGFLLRTVPTRTLLPMLPVASSPQTF